MTARTRIRAPRRASLTTEPAGRSFQPRPFAARIPRTAPPLENPSPASLTEAYLRRRSLQESIRQEGPAGLRAPDSLLQRKAYSLKGLGDPPKVDLRSRTPNKEHKGYDTLTHATLVGNLLEQDDVADFDFDDVFVSRSSGKKGVETGEEPKYEWFRIKAFKRSVDLEPVRVDAQQYYLYKEEPNEPARDLTLGKIIFEEEDQQVEEYKSGLKESTFKKDKKEEDFLDAWNVVADPKHHLGGFKVEEHIPKIGNFDLESRAKVLVISEGLERDTGKKYEMIADVDRTFYETNEETRETEKKYAKTYKGPYGKGKVQPWDIHKEPPFEYAQYDIVIARSAICMCTADDFACGGYSKGEDKKTIEALNRIANLLKPGGTAFITTGTLHITGGDFTSERSVQSSLLGKKMPKRPDSKRFDAKYNTEAFWKDLFGKMEVASTIELTPIFMGDISSLKDFTGVDVPNSLFALKIHRKKGEIEGYTPSRWLKKE